MNTQEVLDDQLFNADIAMMDGGRLRRLVTIEKAQKLYEDRFKIIQTMN